MGLGHKLDVNTVWLARLDDTGDTLVDLVDGNDLTRGGGSTGPVSGLASGLARSLVHSVGDWYTASSDITSVRGALTSNAFTVEMWMDWNSSLLGSFLDILTYSGGTKELLNISNQPTGTFYAGTLSTNGIHSSAGELSSLNGNGKFHFAMRLCSGVVGILINGVVNASVGYSNPFSPGDGADSRLTLGRFLGFSNYADCTIDDIRISNIARTDAEILESYQRGFATVPAAPTVVVAEPSVGSASVSFTGSADPTAAPVTGYTVTASPGGATGSGSSSPITVSGLSDDVSYTFTVHASNEVGNSLESTPSDAIELSSDAPPDSDFPYTFPLSFETDASVGPTTSTMIQLLPPGSVWNLEPDSNMSRTLAAASTEFDRASDRGTALVEEADPRTAVETLDSWESMLGLPDDVITSIPTTTPERQLAVTQKMVARGGQTPAFFIALAAACGYTVTLDEQFARRIMRIGHRIGDRLFGSVWTYTMIVNVSPPVGAALTHAQLEASIRRAAPAHISVVFSYS